MRNLDIRNYAKQKGVKLWQIAAQLGVNDGNFSRKLRFELSDDERKKIFSTIDDLALKEGR